MVLPATAPKTVFGTILVQRGWSRQIYILCSFPVFLYPRMFLSKFVVGIFSVHFGPSNAKHQMQKKSCWLFATQNALPRCLGKKAGTQSQ
jgi:hypothetical protein